MHAGNYSSEENSLTLFDLFKMARWYWKAITAFVLACALVGGCVGFYKTVLEGGQYSSRAVLTVSEPTATIPASELIPFVNAIAANVVATLNDETALEEGPLITEESNPSARIIVFTAVAPTEEESVELANTAARSTIEAAELELKGLAQTYRDSAIADNEEDGVNILLYGSSEKNRVAAYETVTFALQEATLAEAASGTTYVLKLIVVGFLGGIILAVCALIILSATKNPVKGRSDIENSCDIPMLLGADSNDAGLRLWGNIQFAMDGVPRSVCLIPVGDIEIDRLAKKLSEATKTVISLNARPEDGATSDDGTIVVVCESLTKSITTAFDARNADAVVLCVCRWKDPLRAVVNTLSELRLARANVVGFALLEEVK